MEATDKQINYILSLAGRVNDTSAYSFLSQVPGLGLSQREKRGSLTKGRASEIIDDLLGQLKEKN